MLTTFFTQRPSNPSRRRTILQSVGRIAQSPEEQDKKHGGCVCPLRQKAKLGGAQERMGNGTLLFFLVPPLECNVFSTFFKELDLLVSRRGWGLGTPGGQSQTRAHPSLGANSLIYSDPCPCGVAWGSPSPWENRCWSNSARGRAALCGRGEESSFSQQCHHYARFVRNVRWGEGRHNGHTRAWESQTVYKQLTSIMYFEGLL